MIEPHVIVGDSTLRPRNDSELSATSTIPNVRNANDTSVGMTFGNTSRTRIVPFLTPSTWAAFT